MDNVESTYILSISWDSKSWPSLMKPWWYIHVSSNMCPYNNTIKIKPRLQSNGFQYEQRRCDTINLSEQNPSIFAYLEKVSSFARVICAGFTYNLEVDILDKSLILLLSRTKKSIYSLPFRPRLRCFDTCLLVGWVKLGMVCQNQILSFGLRNWCEILIPDGPSEM